METAMINEVRDTSARRNWHPFGKILASDVPGAFALNPQFRQERPPLKIFASCLVLGVNC